MTDPSPLGFIAWITGAGLLPSLCLAGAGVAGYYFASQMRKKKVEIQLPPSSIPNAAAYVAEPVIENPIVEPEKESPNETVAKRLMAQMPNVAMTDAMKNGHDERLDPIVTALDEMQKNAINSLADTLRRMKFKVELPDIKTETVIAPASQPDPIHEE